MSDNLLSKNFFEKINLSPQNDGRLIFVLDELKQKSYFKEIM